MAYLQFQGLGFGPVKFAAGLEYCLRQGRRFQDRRRRVYPAIELRQKRPLYHLDSEARRS